MNRYFSVDLGADSGRCMVGTLENGRLVLEELHRFPTQYFLLEGTLRWNIYRFYEEILTGLRKYAARYGKELCSIGVDTWGCDYGLFDADDRLLDLPYSYRDSRVTGSLEKVLPHKKWLYEKTGIQFLEFNTLNQLIREYENPKSRVKEAARFLFMGDSLHLLLGAPPACEYTTASISMMVDTKEKKWDREILDRFNIPAALCPKLCFAGEVIGVLRGDIADNTGINRGVRIITPAVHDTASAALAIPAKGDDFAYISSGTWSIFGTELDQPVLDQTACDLNISNSGGALGKSLFLKNVMGLWILQQSKRSWNRTNPDLDYNTIMAMAEKARPFFAFIDPDAPAFFNPEDMPEAICAYLEKTRQGEVKPDDIGTISRIIYESLALKYRNVLERIQRAAHKTIRIIHVVGGGSKDRLLNTFIASAAALPVKAGPSEGTAMGNLLLQAYGAGELSSIGQIREIVAASTEIQNFEPTDTGRWQESYGRFLVTLGL
ncbi:rhamnulokinase [Treponema sp. TIM-1]|uniref:rhamnulokinase n=1 Tax=Treponema sp. TIM-1 TaxID=2898417 RepID=UPI003980157A